MPSTFRSPTTPILAALALATVVPAPLRAQQLRAHTSVSLRLSVRPSVVIRSVAPGIARAESGSRVVAPSIVEVESNLPYRLAVRLAPSYATPGQHAAVQVLVRGAGGEFERLVPGRSVTVAVSPTGGHGGHQVVCRVEATAPTLLDAGRCALMFELSGEYQDTMLRTSVTFTAPNHELRTAN